MNILSNEHIAAVCQKMGKTDKEYVNAVTTGALMATGIMKAIAEKALEQVGVSKKDETKFSMLLRACVGSIMEDKLDLVDKVTDALDAVDESIETYEV